MGQIKIIQHPEGINRALLTANWRKIPLFLWTLLFISFCVSCYFGILWIDWNAAISPQDAVKQYPALGAHIDPNWKAILINHGEVTEWSRGTSQQNPEGFRLATYLSNISGAVTLAFIFVVLVLASPKRQPEDQSMASFSKKPQRPLKLH